MGLDTIVTVTEEHLCHTLFKSRRTPEHLGEGIKVSRMEMETETG
jgi:hypothetical protein